MKLEVHVYPENRNWKHAICGADRPTNSRRYLDKGNASKLITKPVWHFEGKKYKVCADCLSRQKAILAEARKALSA